MLRWLALALVLVTLYANTIVFEDGSGRAFGVEFCAPWALCADDS